MERLDRLSQLHVSISVLLLAVGYLLHTARMYSMDQELLSNQERIFVLEQTQCFNEGTTNEY